MLKTHTVYTVPEILNFYDKLWDDQNLTNVENSELIEFLPTIKELSPNIYAKESLGLDPLWGMTYKIAKDTFNYIYRLKTKVYVVRINEGKLEDYILFSPKGSPKELEKFLKKTDPDLRIPNSKKKFIENYNWKFMGCILQYKEDLLQDLTKHAYYKFMSSLDPDIYKYVKNGLYVLSTRDLCLVHKRGMEPWVDVVGEERNDIGFIPKRFLPIFNTTGGENYFDIPIPNFDDVAYTRSLSRDPEGPEDFRDLTTLWDSKKPTAVFRGSATGCGYSPENNDRLRLAKLAQDLNDKTVLDAGITRGDPVREKYIFNRDTGLGFLKIGRYNLSVAERLTKKQQSNYKYIIETEGNVSAHRVLTDMLMGSVLLMIDSEYTLWYSHLLKPYIHYIPIKKDLSNLIETITWCRTHDDLCQAIAEKSLQFAKDLLKLEVLGNTMGNSMIALFK